MFGDGLEMFWNRKRAAGYEINNSAKCLTYFNVLCFIASSIVIQLSILTEVPLVASETWNYCKSFHQQHSCCDCQFISL